jgi:glycosyltransferase involved in cell wall biosynthesis
MPKITVVSPCFNEEGNVEELFQRVKAAFDQLPAYDFDYIFIDNASRDKTVEILKGMAKNDRRVKIIVNTRNFGHIRSPYYGILQGSGEAVIYLASDLQDPPEMIPDFIRKWEEGYKVVWAVKTQSHETPMMFLVRKLYYETISKLSEVELVKNATGFGLYDKRVIEILREIDDPYPYARGLISEIGFEIARIPFTQPRRKRGITKNNFYTLYDIAMLGITNHSKVPLRLATMAGFSLSFLSLLVALGYLAAKLIFWETFSMGMAPIIIGLFFFASVQLFFIGIIGEYVGSIYTQVLKRPLVVEKERINF